MKIVLAMTQRPRNDGRGNRSSSPIWPPKLTLTPDVTTKRHFHVDTSSKRYPKMKLSTTIYKSVYNYIDCSYLVNARNKNNGGGSNVVGLLTESNCYEIALHLKSSRIIIPRRVSCTNTSVLLYIWWINSCKYRQKVKGGIDINVIFPELYSS